MLTNLFATPDRVAAGMGIKPDQVSEFGAFLAALRSPPPLDGLRDGLSRWPMLRAALATHPRMRRHGPVQAHVTETPDLTVPPVQTPGPCDGGPLITWPVVVTRPYGAGVGDVARYNLGVYRAQVLRPDRLILRWLAHRGGAAHVRGWAQAGQPMPVAVVLGAHPATLLAAALPLPEAVSEMTFSGVLRGERAELVPARTLPLMVPAQAEMVIEGWVHPGEIAPEGPFGDHTGYYSAVEPFPVMRVSALMGGHGRGVAITSLIAAGRPDDAVVIAAALVAGLGGLTAPAFLAGIAGKPFHANRFWPGTTAALTAAAALWPPTGMAASVCILLQVRAWPLSGARRGDGAMLVAAWLGLAAGLAAHGLGFRHGAVHLLAMGAIARMIAAINTRAGMRRDNGLPVADCPAMATVALLMLAAGLRIAADVGQLPLYPSLVVWCAGWKPFCPHWPPP
ncbi:MAG: UbiD family decarboxylase [Paracoccus sp. (in: a-proteobacteria)]|nr:UbiD family decarboxylase [Paracoccus sp. (in: a-proteobacteria)]